MTDMELVIAQQLADVGAPEDLAPQLVAIAEEYHVPMLALIGWIRKGSARAITGGAWRAAARAFSKERTP